MLCPVLVGREEPARELRERLQAAIGGTGRVVVIVGEAGIGKSRLARELVDEARKRCTVLTGRALPGYASTGLRAFADALQPAFRTRRPPETEEILPFVAALARLVPEWRSEAVAAPSDPVIVGEGVLRLLRHLAGPTAGVLILEDLHWADAETLAVIDYIADHVATEPVLCVLTCRTDEHSSGSEAIQALIDRRAVDALSLSRLNEADALAMAQACLATGEVALGLPEAVSRADGVPFLVEELLASAVAVGALWREHDRWRLDPAAQWVLPVTAMQATAHVLAGRREQMEAAAAEAFALAAGHPDIAGQVWGNARGLGALLQEQRGSALTALGEAMTFLRDPRCTVPGGIIGPLWALVHTLVDENAAAARDEIRSSRCAGIPIARGLLGYADAVALGRAGEPNPAMASFEQADSLFREYQHLGVRPLGLRLVAEAAINDGWGEPIMWLRQALVFFDEHDLRAVAAACRALLTVAGAPLTRRGRGSSVVPQALRARAVTSREVDVLALIMAGLSNKQISERLYLSPKTVEKHIEHLMDKMGLANRVELTAAAQSAGVAPLTTV